MENVDVIKLEDNKEYIINDEIVIDNITYVYLVNELDISKLVIRKLNITNNQEYLIGLDNIAELNKALNAYTEKHR